MNLVWPFDNSKMRLEIRQLVRACVTHSRLFWSQKIIENSTKIRCGFSKKLEYLITLSLNFVNRCRKHFWDDVQVSGLTANVNDLVLYNPKFMINSLFWIKSFSIKKVHFLLNKWQTMTKRNNMRNSGPPGYGVFVANYSIWFVFLLRRSKNHKLTVPEFNYLYNLDRDECKLRPEELMGDRTEEKILRINRSAIFSTVNTPIKRSWI